MRFERHNKLAPELLTRLVKETDGPSDCMVVLESVVLGVMLLYRPEPKRAAALLDHMSKAVVKRMRADPKKGWPVNDR